MTPIFADTSYYVALLSPRDQNHAAAVRIGADLRQPIVVTEFVLIELANALAGEGSRKQVSQFWNVLRHDPLVTIVPAAAELVNRGFALYERRPDKSWSLTDCISFIVMEELDLKEVLTADRHFEQAGYSILLV